MKSKLGSSKLYFGIFLVIAVVLLLLGIFSDWIVELLWLGSLGYSQVFWTIKATKILLFVGALVVSLLYVQFNMRLIGQRYGHLNFANTPLSQLNIQQISGKSIRRIFTIVGAIISLFFSLAFYMQWDTFFRFNWSETFGQVDPVFGYDLGFYMFRLPFLDVVQGSLVSLVFFVTIISVILYFYSGDISIQSQNNFYVPKKVKKQLSINLGLWFLLLAWGFYLDRYDLLYNSTGAAYGASYIDINVNLPMLWIVFALCLGLALLSFYQIYKARIKWLVAGGIATFIIGVLGLNVLPALIQQFHVDPNELELETPYIENSIELTRKAFELDEMTSKPYSARPPEELSPSTISKNREIIDNIRLWDPRLLIQTYQQLQEIRLYYQFYDVDVDRYQTNEGYKQMMVASRELASELPSGSDSWVNERLQYTHGYGIVMSPVAQEGLRGDPRMVIKNIPPKSEINLEVEQPAIYYGKNETGYKIVNTNIEELDYPKGEQNVYNHYQGKGGVSINNLFEQLLFSWKFNDINILLTDYINDQSKIQFWQSIKDRVQRVAPFLEFKDDPYLILSDGKLYWMTEAYTTSDKFPYSSPYENQFNYIRNSVKIVVDAYNGSVDLYATSDNDPILNVYRNIFPDMFKTIEDMPEGLRDHVRYPEHLFKVQLEKYNRYHMTNPRIFYNNEDLWTRPNETYGGRTILQEPFYVLTKLPGEDKFQYFLISPFTPSNKDNMIGWMAANSDYPDYGDVTVFELPKDRLIFGPAQIESRIEQNTEISRQLSLWDQRGSKVIRGNLMVIPIEDTFIYVEPVFLIAKGINIPQLKRIIATTGDEIAMEPTLWGAIQALYGTQIPSVITPTDSSTVIPTIQVPTGESNKVSKIKNLFQEANEAIEQQDWAKYGSKMDEIKDLLNNNNDNKDKSQE